jgi:hypothetical protein
MSQSTNKTLQDIDKIRIVDIIIEHYPELKKDRNHIINVILEKIEKPDRYILERIDLNNKVYYKDNDNILIDVNLNICGLCVDLGNNTFKYILNVNSTRKQDKIKLLKNMDKLIKSKLINQE